MTAVPQGPAWAVALWLEAESALHASDQADVRSLAASVHDAECARVRWADRWSAAAARQQQVRVHLDGGCAVQGCVVTAGRDLMVLREPTGTGWVISTEAVIVASNLPLTLGRSDSVTPEPAFVLTWSSALRDARFANCRVHLRSGTVLVGVPTVVGADFVDVRTADGEHVALPLMGVAGIVVPNRVVEDLAWPT